MQNATRLFLFALAVALVAAGCGSDDSADAPTQPVPVSVTWDGTSCEYAGPAEISGSETAVELTAVNTSSGLVRVLVNLMRPGATLDQITRYGENHGLNSPRPPFATDRFVWTEARPANSFVKTINLEPGLWFAGCGVVDMDRVLAGELFEVTG